MKKEDIKKVEQATDGFYVGYAYIAGYCQSCVVVFVADRREIC